MVVAVVGPEPDQHHVAVGGDVDALPVVALAPEVGAGPGARPRPPVVLEPRSVPVSTRVDSRIQARGTGRLPSPGALVAQGDAGEAGVAVGQLGQVAGDGVVDRADAALGSCIGPCPPS